MEDPARTTLKILVDYILVACPGDARDGKTAADVAIGWHREVKKLRKQIEKMQEQMRPAPATPTPPVGQPTNAQPPPGLPQGGPPPGDNDTPAWELAVEQCEAILDMVEELPERAEEFGEGVSERVKDIQGWVSEHHHVTGKQTAALQNMEDAVVRWLWRGA